MTSFYSIQSGPVSFLLARVNLDVTLNLREIGLLLPELLQFHVSKGTDISDGPVSDTELC